VNRRILLVLARLGVAFGSTIVVFWLLIDSWRNVEARVVTTLFGSLGARGASQSFGNQILVIPTNSRPFLGAGGGRVEFRLRCDFCSIGAGTAIFVGPLDSPVEATL